MYISQILLKTSYCEESALMDLNQGGQILEDTEKFLVTSDGPPYLG